MFPAMQQNKSQRPRMSFLMPAMLTTNLSDSSNTNGSNKTEQTVAFMQIDCEVVDTQLIYFKMNEIPTNFMKIFHQDYVINQQADSTKEFFNYYSNNAGF